MNPSEIIKATNTPCKVLAMKNDGEMVWIQLPRAATHEEMNRLETENGFRFYENCNSEEQAEMTKFLIDNMPSEYDS